MNDHPEFRRPGAFRLDDPKVVVKPTLEDTARPRRGTVHVALEAEPSALPVALDEATLVPRRRFRWGAVFWAALTGLVLLGAGLSVTRLVDDLFARNDGLGVLGLTLAVAGALALVVITVREIRGLARLATIEKMHARAASVLASDDRREGHAVASELLRLASDNPRLARARANLGNHLADIIDGADLVRLAERELMAPLDREARKLISQAAQRVSIVTAVSPHAVIDLAFVFISALRLIRQLAFLYGGRPGTLGMISLFRQVIAHLAITGGVAASDSLIQQMLGHGIAAKLSSRLGEGVINGLLTARLGLAAVDVIRPLPFTALPPPVLSDLVKDLFRQDGDAPPQPRTAPT